MEKFSNFLYEYFGFGSQNENPNKIQQKFMHRLFPWKFYVSNVVHSKIANLTFGVRISASEWIFQPIA